MTKEEFKTKKEELLSEIPKEFHLFVTALAWELGHTGWPQTINYMIMIIEDLKPAIKNYTTGCTCHHCMMVAVNDLDKRVRKMENNIFAVSKTVTIEEQLSMVQQAHRAGVEDGKKQAAQWVLDRFDAESKQYGVSPYLLDCIIEHTKKHFGLEE